jgi:anti-sigma regulatory factor (Ser/Thr protein kinase)
VEIKSFAVQEGSGVGEARREATRIARELGFDDSGTEKVAIAVAEVGTNLFKHGGGGEILVGAASDGSLEVIALDRGRGIADLEVSFRDGYSTSGSPGNGLGAVRRLSSAFDIYTRPELGTALLAKFSPLAPASPARRIRGIEIGGACVALRGEHVSGDSWAARETSVGVAILVADGLGHGPGAAEASREAVRIFLESKSLQGAQVLEAIHEALRKTRGAAVSLAEVDLSRGLLRFSGVGNVGGTIVQGDEIRKAACMNGTAGHTMARLQEFTYPFGSSGVLLLHSDGIKTSLRLDGHPGLLSRLPSLAAAVLYRDFARGTDDVTVVVARRTT